jgi:hypothetical protein
MNLEAEKAVYAIERAVGRRLPELEQLTRGDAKIGPALMRELHQLALYIDQAINSAKRQGQQDLMRGRLR